MTRPPVQPDSGPEILREILLGYLQSAQIPAWPGGDGLTIEDLLDCYPRAVASGLVPDWQQLRRAHPELDASLHDWLATKDRWAFALSRPMWRRRGG